MDGTVQHQGDVFGWRSSRAEERGGGPVRDGVLPSYNSDLLTPRLQFVPVWFGRRTRLQMGLLICSFEGKVDRQMAEDDAERLRLGREGRRHR